MKKPLPLIYWVLSTSASPRSKTVSSRLHAHGLEDKFRDFPRLRPISLSARKEAGLIVTGGFAPNIEGWLSPFGSRLASSGAARKHRVITDAVHAEDGKIALQILHGGRYGYSPLSVARARKSARRSRRSCRAN